LEAVRAGGDDGHVALEPAGVGLHEELVAGVVELLHLSARVDVHAVDLGGLVDERLGGHAVVDDVAVRRLEREHLLVVVAALDDLRFEVRDFLAVDGVQFRVEVAEALLVVAGFELPDLLVADAQHHLRALAVHLAVRVGVLEVARQQLRALLDVLGLLERVVRLDVAEVQRLGVVRAVGVDGRNLVFFLHQRDVLDVRELRRRVQQRSPTDTSADDE